MNIQMVVTANIAARIAHIRELDLSEEKSRLNVEPEVADVIEDEFKKYLALHALQPGSYAVPGIVDNLWHIFLEDSAKVAALEADIGVCIEHRPDNPRETWEALMEHTKSVYKTFFGPAPALYDDTGMLCWGCGVECITNTTTN